MAVVVMAFFGWCFVGGQAGPTVEAVSGGWRIGVERARHAPGLRLRGIE
jgi:hypothetical protein